MQLKVTSIALAFAILAGAPHRASAYFKDGNDVLRDCTEAPLLCLGYLMGIHDGIEISTAAGAPRAYCLPVNVQANQVQDVVLNFLRDHPEKRHWMASSLAWNALAEAFPCPK